MIIKKIYHQIQAFLTRKYKQPVMISGYCCQGIQLPRTRISSSTFIDHPQSLHIEDNVYIGHYNFIEASNGLTIEKGVQITNFCNISTHSSHISIRLYGDHYKEVTDHVGYVKGEIKIGSYTFVGPHSTIMPGTSIGKGCLIRAYSYVKGTFPDFSVIGGAPARIIGSTKDIDQPFIDDNPQLHTIYQE